MSDIIISAIIAALSSILGKFIDIDTKRKLGELRELRNQAKMLKKEMLVLISMVLKQAHVIGTLETVLEEIEKNVPITPESLL